MSVLSYGRGGEVFCFFSTAFHSSTPRHTNVVNIMCLQTQLHFLCIYSCMFAACGRQCNYVMLEEFHGNQIFAADSKYVRHQIMKENSILGCHISGL